MEDKNKLIGKLINVIFKLKNGDEYSIAFNSKSDIYAIKINFLYELFKQCSKEHLDLKFLYKNYNIKFDDKKTIEDLFKNDDKPEIFIQDPKNIIGKKIKITFKINNAYTKEIISQTENTIGYLIRTFLIEIDENFNLYPKTFIFSEYENWIMIRKFIMQIHFLYKGKPINWFIDNQQNNKVIYNITSIGDYFENDNNPVIFVMDTNNYLSLFNINITFKTTYGHCFNFIISSIRTVDHLLTQYIYEIQHSELVDTNKITFFYQNKQLNFGDSTSLHEVFLNNINPLITIMDINYLLNNNLLNKLNLIFKRPDGRNYTITVNFGTTVEQAIKMYLYLICESESLDNYYYYITKKDIGFRFRFIYNAKQIYIGEKQNVESYFGPGSPLIIVN